MVNGIVLLAVILFLPNGIASIPDRLRERRRRADHPAAPEAAK